MIGPSRFGAWPTASACKHFKAIREYPFRMASAACITPAQYCPRKVRWGCNGCWLRPVPGHRGRLYFGRCICNGRSEATWGQGHAAYCLLIRSLYFGCCKSNGRSKVIWDERARCLAALLGRLLCYQCTQLIFVLADETDDACVFLQPRSRVGGIQPRRYVGG